MRQVVQRRKRGAVGQLGRRLDHCGFTIGAAVGDLEHTARFAPELARDGVEVGRINHRARVVVGRRVGWRRVGGGTSPGITGAPGGEITGGAPCGASEMVFHSAVYQGSLLPTGAAAWPGLSGVIAPCGQLHLIRNIAGHHEAQPFPGLGGDEHRIVELGLLLFEIADLGPQRGLGGDELLHLGALREVGPHRAGDRQRQHAHHRGQDRRAARGEARAAARPARRLAAGFLRRWTAAAGSTTSGLAFCCLAQRPP